MRLVLLFFCITLCSCSSKSWREASRESARIATPALQQTEDIIQIYHARAFSWRGYFGIHPWIAWKLSEDKEYTVAQVTAWNLRRQPTSVSVDQDLPDRYWYDSKPTLMFELTGSKARQAIANVKAAIATYPFQKQYRVWPGPNSNTFVAHIIRSVDELDIELPASAIGKDYLGNQFFAPSPSGTGFQFSAFGAFGLTAGLGEGLELNLLGLSFGIDFYTPALKLPLVGRLGFADASFD